MRHLELAGIFSLLLVTFAARPAIAQPRTCVRADIEEPFVLPDGSRHPAGLLRICLDRDYSPVAGLHSIVASDQRTGTFLSRRVRPEGARQASPQLAFVRNPAGALVLRGYTLERGGKVDAYWLEPPRGKRAAPQESLLARSPESGTLWLAAARIP